jgi:hypothetical protein
MIKTSREVRCPVTNTGGLLQKATICAGTLVAAHYTIRELWPALRLVRITKEEDW